MAVVPNRFGIYPLVEGPGRHVYPKTTTFCLVLGFTPSREACRAHQSQNDLEQLYSGPFVALPGVCVALPSPVLPLPGATPASAKASVLPGSHPGIRKGVNASRQPPRHPQRHQCFPTATPAPTPVPEAPVAAVAAVAPVAAGRFPVWPKERRGPSASRQYFSSKSEGWR